VLGEHDVPVDGALVTVSGDAGSSQLCRWKRAVTTKPMTKRFEADHFAKRDPVTGQAPIPAALEQAVMADNRTHVRQRHLFDPALAGFVGTIVEQLVTETRACIASGIAPGWPRLSRHLELAQAALLAEAGSAGGAAAASAASAAIPAVSSLPAGDVEDMRGILDMQAAVADRSALAFPPLVGEGEVPALTAHLGTEEEVKAALELAEAERTELRQGTTTALLRFVKGVWSRARHHRGIRPVLTNLARLVSLDVTLAGGTLEQLVPPFYVDKHIAAILLGTCLLATKASRTKPSLQFGAVTLTQATPPLAALMVSCPVAEVRLGWADFMTRLLHVTASHDEARLSQVAVVEQEEMQCVALDDGTTGNELRLVRRTVPATVTARVLERLCHPVTVDHAVVHWHTWDAFTQLLARMASEGQAMRELLVDLRLHLVLLDSITGKTSSLAYPEAGHFRNRAYSTFYMKKTERRADMTYAVRCLRLLMCSMGPPGYYLAGLGLPSQTTIITGNADRDKKLCEGSTKRALEAAYAKSKAGSEGNPPLTREQLMQLQPSALDEAAECPSVLTLARVAYAMFSHAALWSRLLRCNSDSADLIRLASHVSFGATDDNITAPLHAILNFFSKNAGEDDAPRMSDLLEALVQLPDRQSTQRIRVLLFGSHANPTTGAAAVDGMLDIIVSDMERYPADTFELLWVVVRLCRVSDKFLQALATAPAIADLEFYLYRFQRLLVGADSTRTLDLRTGERAIRRGTPQYRRALDAVSMTTRPPYSARDEAASLRALRLGRDERATIMLAQLEALLTPLGLGLQGHEALFEPDDAADADAIDAAAAIDAEVGGSAPAPGEDDLGVD
jgi:hypothetical protein